MLLMLFVNASREGPEHMYCWGVNNLFSFFLPFSLSFSSLRSP